jgi:hypothetical protein
MTISFQVQNNGSWLVIYMNFYPSMQQESNFFFTVTQQESKNQQEAFKSHLHIQLEKIEAQDCISTPVGK